MTPPDRLQEILRQHGSGISPVLGNAEWLLVEVVRLRKRLDVVEPLIDQVLACDGSMLGALVPHALMRDLKSARES